MVQITFLGNSHVFFFRVYTVGAVPILFSASYLGCRLVQPFRRSQTPRHTCPIFDLPQALPYLQYGV